MTNEHDSPDDVDLPPGVPDSCPDADSVGVDSDVRPCVCRHCLQWVRVLDGEDWTTGQVDQYVNLPKERRFLNARLGRPNLDRLSNTLRIRVKLRERETATCELRLTATLGEEESLGRRELVYSDDEKGRNDNYKLWIAGNEQSNHDSGDRENWIVTRVARGEATIEVKVDMCGGKEFTLEARCPRCQGSMQGPPLSCGPIVIKRRIWVLPILMQDLQVNPPRPHSIEQEFRRYNLEVRFLTAQTMRFHRAILQENFWEQARFMAAARAVSQRYWRGREQLHPYVITIIFVDQIGNRRGAWHEEERRRFRRSDYERSEGKMRIELRSEADGEGFRLWRTGENDTDDWLVEATYQTAGGQTLDLRTYCEPGNDENSVVLVDVEQGVFRELERIPGEDAALARGTLRLRVHVVGEWSGGYASAPTYFSYWLGRQNINVVTTRDGFRPKSVNRIRLDELHELGHLLGLVPDGLIVGRAFYRTTDLDRSPMLYNNRGHMGNHCSYGIRTEAEPALPESMSGRIGGCIMFGSSNREPHFCPRCRAAIRKEDISEGWDRFDDEINFDTITY